MRNGDVVTAEAILNRFINKLEIRGDVYKRQGPGDEVIIDIWGASQNTIRQQISPDGTINIQKIGPVNLNGLTTVSYTHL